MSTTPAKNLSLVMLTPPNSLSPVSLAPLINIHSRLSRRIFEMILMDYSGARGTLIHEKKLRSKISCQTPFNKLHRTKLYRRHMIWLLPSPLPPSPVRKRDHLRHT
jgi:hypothetical protein